MDHYISHSPNSVPSISLKDARNGQAQLQQSVATTHQPSTSPQHLPTLSNKELRDKVVEILSTTANGCLTELGYFPGMSQRLQELEVTNQKWQAENVKLFEDNRNLLITVTDMRERESLVSTQDLDKINRIRNLELQLAAVRKDSIPKVKFDDLHKHFASLRVSYATAYDELARLTQHLNNVGSLAAQSGLTLPPPPPRKASANSHLQSHLHPSSSLTPPEQPQQPAPAQHPAPPGVWQGGQPIQVVESAPGTSMGGPAPQMAPQRQLSQPVGQRQDESLYHSSRQAQEHQQAMNQHTHRSSMNAQSVYPSPHPQHYHSQSMLPGTMAPSPTTQLPQNQQGHQQPPSPYTQYHSATHGRHDRQIIGNSQNTSYPPNPYPPAASSPQFPQNPYPPAPSTQFAQYQSQQIPHQSPFHPAFHPASGLRGSSAPLSLDTNMRPVKVEMPPTPLSASHPHSSSPFSVSMHQPPQPLEHRPSNRMPPPNGAPTHHQPPHFGPPQTFPTPAQIHALNLQAQHYQGQITTMSPTDMYINPAAIAGHQQRYSNPNEQADVPQDARESESTTPDQTSTPAPLKRNSVTMLEGVDLEEESQKRPRLEDLPHQSSEPVYEHGHPAGSYVTDQTQYMYSSPDEAYTQIYAPAPSEPVSAPRLDQSMSTYAMDSGMMHGDVNNVEEDDMEYEVEVGPDGLRLVRDCLEEIFARQEGGGRLCGLCLIRQQRNQISEPPMPFINATDDDLETHCLTEHEKAWSIARQVD